VSLLALLGFLLNLIEASLEPDEGLQEHVVIGYLVTRVGIGQEGLEALPDRLDAGELLVAELDAQLVCRVLGRLGHGGASDQYEARCVISILVCNLLLVKVVATGACP
jgi:hypothetical protein